MKRKDEIAVRRTIEHVVNRAMGKVYDALTVAGFAVTATTTTPNAYGETFSNVSINPSRYDVHVREIVREEIEEALKVARLDEIKAQVECVSAQASESMLHATSLRDDLDADRTRETADAASSRSQVENSNAPISRYVAVGEYVYDREENRYARAEHSAWMLAAIINAPGFRTDHLEWEDAA